MAERDQLETVVVTGEGIATLGPYVPALDDHGRVTFQARLDDGRTTVLAREDGALVELVAPGLVREVTSHPDREEGSPTCFYALLHDGSTAACAVRDGALVVLAGREHGLDAVGPAGPTTNAEGDVALRATTSAGPVALLAGAEGVRRVAGPQDGIAVLHGLPVVDAAGRVVVRADRTDGVQGIYRRTAAGLEAVVETGAAFSELARFPDVADDGTVVFAAVTREGTSVVAVASPDGRIAVIDSAGPFASFRGALVDGNGRVLRLATPEGGGLGLFDGPDPATDRIVAVGDALLGATVADLAANPVSVNRAGDVAVRVGLDDGREAVVVSRRAVASHR